MATCGVCGAYGPDDPETGYAEEVCPDCASRGWERDRRGQYHQPDRESFDPDAYRADEAIADYEGK